jgi:hypothetical protein
LAASALTTKALPMQASAVSAIIRAARPSERRAS